MKNTGNFQYELYQHLITMSWGRFLLYLLGGYMITNAFFAVIYYAIGINHLTGINPDASPIQQWTEAFFFSSQTLTTLGYGRIAPVGLLTSALATVESMLGLSVFALATSVLYGRFSRPQARVLLSHHAVIGSYDGFNALTFRVANARHDQLVEVEVEVTLNYIEPGATSHSYIVLQLERRRMNILPSNWTLIHKINEESPIWKMGIPEFHKLKAEIVVLVKAFDDTFSQIVHTRTSYQGDEILMDKRFISMHPHHDNKILDLDLLDAVEDAPLIEQPQPKADLSAVTV